MGRFRTRDSVVSSRVGDETVLLDLVSGTYHTLNETATFIWERLNDGMNLDEIVERLADEYGVSPEQAREDLDSFADSSVADGLLQRV